MNNKRTDYAIALIMCCFCAFIIVLGLSGCEEIKTINYHNYEAARAVQVGDMVIGMINEWPNCRLVYGEVISIKSQLIVIRDEKGETFIIHKERLQEIVKHAKDEGGEEYVFRFTTDDIYRLHAFDHGVCRSKAWRADR